VLAGKLLYKCKPVITSSLTNCLKSFLDYLKSFKQQVVLVADSNKVFDSRILVKAFRSSNMLDMLEELHSVVVGFVDTLPLLREIIHNRK
jgi:predicted house-cleaning NTP pyrophosphatase (Maf/HAM1 superfamily)